MRELAENGDSSGLLDAVRERPDDARQALRQILERAASTDSVNALSHFASAERLARAYSDVWADSFPLRQVAQFAAWSPPQRSAKVSTDSLRRAGNAALGRSGAAAALEDWRESYRRCAALADTAGMAAALGNIGAGFYRTADLDSAEAYLDQSRRLAESAGDRRTAVNALGILASVSKDRGDLQRAREMYTQALAVRQRIGDVRGMASDQNNLGLVAELLGDLGGAREAYAEALALSRTHGLTEPAAVALINLGNVASTEGDYGEAGARYGEALEIYRDMGSRVDAAFVLHNLGLLELRRGDYAGARARLSDALAIYRQTGPVAEAVSVRRDLAAADAAIGNLETASRQLRRAEQLARRAPASPALAGSLALARADLAVQFNAPVEAGRQYTRAEQLYRRANDGAGQAEAQAGKGFVLLLREDYTRARATLELAARTEQAWGGRRSAAWTRLLVGDVQRRQGDTAAARRSLTQALDSLRSLNDVVGEAAGLGALGELNTQAGMAVTAESLYRRGLEGLRDRIAPDVSWQLHEGLGRALRNRHALPEAAAELQAAAADVERVAGALPVADRRTP